MKIFIFIHVTILFVCAYLMTAMGQVTLNGNQLFVNGEVYAIRGVCWSPSGIGDTFGNKFTDWYQTDLPLIADMNANTIRTYVPIYDVNILNAIQSHGLKVIVGFTAVDTSQDLAYISQFKNHEAILMWCFGNEFNYHPEWFDGDILNWYSKLERLAQRAGEIDPNHPVTTAHGELPDSFARAMCPSIQFWGVNVYRWDNLFFLFEDWGDWSTKPIWIAESGADSYHTEFLNPPSGFESETNQDSANQNIWQQVHNNLSAIDPQKQCLGITFFEFNDEWWKAGNCDSQDVGIDSPPGMPYDNFFNEEYFGFVKIDRTPKSTYMHIKEIWGKTATSIEGLEDEKRLSSPVLFQNYPNPFNPTTQIRFWLPTTTDVKIKVYDLLGQKVVVLLDTHKPAGYHTVEFDGRRFSSGLYFYRIDTPTCEQVKKMLLVK